MIIHESILLVRPDWDYYIIRTNNQPTMFIQGDDLLFHASKLFSHINIQRVKTGDLPKFSIESKKFENLKHIPQSNLPSLNSVNVIYDCSLLFRHLLHRQDLLKSPRGQLPITFNAEKVIPYARHCWFFSKRWQLFINIPRITQGILI